MSRKAELLTGQRFGRLVVTGKAEHDKHGHACWNCICDCGKEIAATSSNLKSGNTKSCGCLHNEKLSKRNAETKTTHGMTRTRLHIIWCDMRARCSYEKDKCYHLYGGRGITVCEEWQKSFTAFRDWALENGYSDNLTLDRIDNDKGYSPENCKWSTHAEQRRNQRRNKEEAL